MTKIILVVKSLQISFFFGLSWLFSAFTSILPFGIQGAVEPSVGSCCVKSTRLQWSNECAGKSNPWRGTSEHAEALSLKTPSWTYGEGYGHTTRVRNMSKVCLTSILQ